MRSWMALTSKRCAKYCPNLLQGKGHWTCALQMHYFSLLFALQFPTMPPLFKRLNFIDKTPPKLSPNQNQLNGNAMHIKPTTDWNCYTLLIRSDFHVNCSPPSQLQSDILNSCHELPRPHSLCGVGQRCHGYVSRTAGTQPGRRLDCPSLADVGMQPLSKYPRKTEDAHL